MDVNDKVVLRLLQIIGEDSSIKKMKKFGLSYREVGDLIESNIANGNLDGDDITLRLTDQGKQYLASNILLIKETDKSKWIDLDFKSKVEKIDKEHVFLPSRNDLSFLK